MRQSRHEALARGLGWFSIAIGLAELCLTRMVARASGMEGRESVLRVYGVREIATGIGLLVARDPAPWLWGRAAGDALDLATLASGAGRDGAAAMLAVGGVAALDVYAATVTATHRGQERVAYDYSSRSGFPRPAAEMRGIARTQKTQTRVSPATAAI
jgi:hypothetical protein